VNPKRTRFTTAFLAIGLAGALLVGCGDDGDDNAGGQNVPGGNNQTVESTGTREPGAGGNQSTGNSTGGNPPIKIVDATPVTRRGSDGSMAGNRSGATPEASPGASPVASPEASPAP
jgi:hypothetical protein